VRDRAFLNLDLSLDREMSLALEMATMNELVGKEDLERWAMKGEDVEGALHAVVERWGTRSEDVQGAIDTVVERQEGEPGTNRESSKTKTRKCYRCSFWARTL
jgi:hypothetical protein